MGGLGKVKGIQIIRCEITIRAMTLMTTTEEALEEEELEGAEEMEDWLILVNQTLAAAEAEAEE